MVASNGQWHLQKKNQPDRTTNKDFPHTLPMLFFTFGWIFSRTFWQAPARTLKKGVSGHGIITLSGIYQKKGNFVRSSNPILVCVKKMLRFA